MIMPKRRQTRFARDLAEARKDPKYDRAFRKERAAIDLTDKIVHALDAARVRPAPVALRAIFTWVPLPLATAYWRTYLSGARGEILFAAHARHAAHEMATIGYEVAAIMRGTAEQTPTFDRLSRSIPDLS